MPPTAFNETPENCQTPYDTKQRPAPRAAQYAEGEGCGRSRDEQEDRAVIDDSKHTFRVVPRQRVIQGRGHVQDDDRSREHARTDNIADVTTSSGGQHEEWSRHQSREGANPVAHAIRDFFSEGRLPSGVGTPSPIASDLTRPCPTRARRGVQHGRTQAEYVFGTSIRLSIAQALMACSLSPRSAPPGSRSRN